MNYPSLAFILDLFPLINTAIMVAAIVLLCKIVKRLSFLNQQGESNLVEAANETFRRLEYVTRWQKLLARMIKDDREALKQHDANVLELNIIAKNLQEKFLSEKAQTADDNNKPTP